MKKHLCGVSVCLVWGLGLCPGRVFGVFMGWFSYPSIKLYDFPAGGWKPNWRTRMAWRRIKRKDRMVPCKLRRENPRKRSPCASQTSDWVHLHPCTQSGRAWDPRTFGGNLRALHDPQQLGWLQLHVRVGMLFWWVLKCPLGSPFFPLNIFVVWAVPLCGGAGSLL